MILKMNSRGFNLFSALVAAVLLMSGVVLINMLISTEEKIGTEVYLMTNNFSLSDAASIAKADALQSFNYNFRESLEDYLTLSEAEIADGTTFDLINTDDLGGNQWNTLLQNFETAVLLSGTTIKDEDGTEIERQNFEAVIQYVADRTINQFHDGRYGRYHVSLSSRDSEAVNAVRTVMENVIVKNAGEMDFLKVVGCDATSCEVGTFYFIIPLDLMTNEDYEALPRIVVKDLITGEEIKVALLPKTRLNIYIPLRFFKAVHESIRNAKAIQNVETMIGAKAMLGYCDSGSCVPRKDPLQATSGNWDKECRNTSETGIRQELTSHSLLITDDYKIIQNQIGAVALRAFAKFHGCEYGVAEYYYYHAQDPTFTNYNWTTVGLEGELSIGIKGYPKCPFNKINGIIKSNETKDLSGTGGGAGTGLYCSTLTKIEASVMFVDTNPLYIVSGEKNVYRIGINGKSFDAMQSNLGSCSSGSNQCCIPGTCP